MWSSKVTNLCLLLAVHPGIVPNMRQIKMRYPKPRDEKHFRTLRKTDKQVSLMGKMRASKHRRELCDSERAVSYKNTLRVDGDGAQ
ncbi:MAG: hypothetical protein CMM45_02830 [Rhodospirillaceae bacterium]|nr:hypothetical protein [Rhodospirillaceae bacterium]